MPLKNTSDRYQQQRVAAIQAAASVFASKGFHGASTADLARAMGIKQGSIYYYFKSKQEALEEVCFLALKDYVHRMELVANAEQNFEAKLLATVSSHLSGYREKNEALKVYNDERLYLPESKRRGLKKLGTHYRELLENLFDEAIADGAVRETLDSHFAAQAVIGICNAMGDLIVRDADLDVFELTQKCTDLLLHGFHQHQ